MTETLTCLCCGCVYDAGLEMCPERYLSEHSTEFAVRVARRLLAHGVSGQPSRGQLRDAIEYVRRVTA